VTPLKGEKEILFDIFKKISEKFCSAQILKTETIYYFKKPQKTENARAI